MYTTVKCVVTKIEYRKKVDANLCEYGIKLIRKTTLHNRRKSICNLSVMVFYQQTHGSYQNYLYGNQHWNYELEICITFSYLLGGKRQGPVRVNSHPPLSLGLDKPVLHPRPCKILLISLLISDIIIQNHVRYNHVKKLAYV